MMREAETGVMWGHEPMKAGSFQKLEKAQNASSLEKKCSSTGILILAYTFQTYVLQNCQKICCVLSQVTKFMIQKQQETSIKKKCDV